MDTNGGRVEVTITKKPKYPHVTHTREYQYELKLRAVGGESEITVLEQCINALLIREDSDGH